MIDAELRICVIGAGPRGTSLLERLLANDPGGRPLTVHVIDGFPAGAGSVWRTDQDPGLLMNTVASQVTLYTDASVRCAGPIRPGPDLHEWASRLEPAGYPAWVRDEAATLGPDDYPSRALYGHYLRWVFASLGLSAEPHVKIVVHPVNAVALDDQTDGRQLVTLADGVMLGGLDAVVLALGHGPVVRTREEEDLAGFAQRNALTYVGQANPADVDLSSVAPGETVVLRGLGLAFFDYLHLLTAGRGGRFRRDSAGLHYEPSGREPALLAGSRRGIPYQARGENQKGADGRHRPLFLTPAKIGELRALALAGSPLTFRDSVWPLVDREVRAVYYRALLAVRSPQLAALFEARFAADPSDAVAARHGITRLWDWSWVTRPYGARRFADEEEFADWLLGYLREDVAQARLGNVHGPVKAALDVLRDLRNEIRLVVDHSGIDGDSYRDELERWYTPLNAFASIGPPARRIEETIALLEAGILRMTGPGLTIDAADGAFAVRSSLGLDERTRVLVEARLPEPDVRRSGNPLLRYLLATGQSQSYRIRAGETGCYESGGLAVSAPPYRTLDRNGRPHPARFAFGVPTEGVHWITAAGIRPGVGSVTLEDADAIARAVLDCRSHSRPASAQPLHA